MACAGLQGARCFADFIFVMKVRSCVHADLTIEIIKNGPYIVKGEVEMKDADGNIYRRPTSGPKQLPGQRFAGPPMAAGKSFSFGQAVFDGQDGFFVVEVGGR